MIILAYLAHTGQRLQAEPGTFASLDAFQAWIAKHSSISAQDQICLTEQGRPVKFQTLSTEKEIFVYDRRIVAPTSTSARLLPADVPLPATYNASRPPDTISDETDLQAWKDLFMQRRSWALQVADDCTAMSVEAQQRYGEVEVIARGIEAATSNLERHVKILDEKNAKLQGWATKLQGKDDLLSTDWEGNTRWLQSIPVTQDMIRFISRDESHSGQQPTLESLINAEEVIKAGQFARTISDILNQQSGSIGRQFDEVLKKFDDLSDRIDKGPAVSIMARPEEASQLLPDIEAIAKKISSDYENVLGYSDTPKNIAQASRSALQHTRNLLPSLTKRSLEMYNILKMITETRNSVASDSLGAMGAVASVTKMISEANTSFTSLPSIADGLDAIVHLSMVNSLPVTYASFMAEAIRRREWNDKVKSDSSTLANEMAAFQDEESRRRRKWQKSAGTSFWGNMPEGKVIGLEVNLMGDEEDWPQVNREDLDDFLQDLHVSGADSTTIAEITKLIADLNNPTKQQKQRAKAFKAGSIHENALGRSALLMRGDDDLLRIMQDEKQKMESKLKTAESRVRRLEDLLHRQPQVSRTSTGNVFQPSGFPSSDTQAALNPLASHRLLEDTSRRFSANQGPDEKTFQQKLLSLEAELIAERERAAGLEREVSARKTSAVDMQAHVEEVTSTKKDLMENFEAQQREFSAERKSLEVDIRQYKARMDELEDDLIRLSGSRDNERTTIDERIRVLETELERVRKDATLEAQKSQGQVDYLRNDAKMQRETNEMLQQQLQRARDDSRDHLSRANLAEEASRSQVKTLRDIHSQIAPDTAVLEDFTEFGDLLVTLSRDLIGELTSAKNDATIVKSDIDAANLATTNLKSRLDELEGMLAAEENESSQLRKDLAAQQAKFDALETELADERSQLSSLRSKMADGETGSETMRLRLEEEEKKVTSMSEDLATRGSRIGSLEEELRSTQEKHHAVLAKHDKLNSRFEARSMHTRDLTQRVYSQNDRLCRLLVRLSYSVTRDGSSMTIQRLPRPERSSTANDSSDPGTSIRRSISAALPQQDLVASTDLGLLHWMHDEDPDVENETFNAYLNAFGDFDVEQFCDVVAKRVSNMEYTAKKYNKDARAYREKSHSAQKEAHEKIAFKNFKEGDLALFLPTRNQATGAWAAFNVGAPHYFLREQESHKLRTRDWLLARIHKIEDRVVDLSKSLSGGHANVSDGRSFGETSNGGDSFEDDNPFDLSDGLRWYLIDAAEEKPGAPTTPGLGKSTVASTIDHATGSIRRSKKSSSSGVDGINKTLSKSLDSRRSSNNSKKSVGAIASTLIKTGSTATDTASLKAVATTQATSGDASEAQSIASTSRQEGTGNPEVVATKAGTSPSKKSMIWDSLWSLDLSLESGKGRKYTSHA